MRAVRRNPSQWNPAQRWERQRFRIRLLCGERAPRALTHGAIPELIASLPSKPAEYCINSTGYEAAELVFYQWRDILDAIVHLWSLRLAGSHRLVPVLESSAYAPSSKTEVEARLKSVFSGYARKLLESDAVLKCEKRILDLKGDIHKVVLRLKKRNTFAIHAELTAKKKNLEAELTLVKSRLGEFRAAVGCVLAYLGESKNQKAEKEEVDDVVQLFRFGTEFDWRRIHLVLERECQRLEAGLPIYASRREILRTIKFNQVTVLIGETGSGKSTQLVQFLADSGLTADGSVVCTQPRRIAALSLGPG
ncbi:hypothetical protein J5N97_002973 [Dioscorea zingiberensis]|uniref:Uncharacterized protein n=1 Tax=Dioscorea zingiberensis TaxID=325984 RepID=A0A9D5HQV1_9LILI|nr:hypothetical protein J5N97_002973 [Dioscorea zingiberensis]